MFKDKAILFFPKRIDARELKQYFGPKWTLEDIESAYLSFLVDLVDEFHKTLKLTAFLYHSNPERHNSLFEVFHNNVEVRHLPTKDDLLASAVEHVFNDGFKRIVLLNCYNPLLPIQNLQLAFVLLNLDEDIITIGPCENRNCYLLGMKAPHIDLLQNVDVFLRESYESLLKKICSLNIMVFPLKKWYDIVTPNDFARLKAEIERMIVAKKEYPKKTYEFLRQIGRKYKFKN